ncbi:Flp pilus assembly protein CpaB [Stratiformator vulcanicus]|uniref:SAF domain-containing protein n=1 Tax=Stratiformator vulcanicus TaxID=2527980 RepID=A0A517R2P2_9PLAN|nr:Flp pilus assembly protein CpaB [Stratiformator vulcanicus]QDT38142.1 hypothetical protein Pan189_25320 [Stratiformator vulcanicus]
MRFTPALLVLIMFVVVGGLIAAYVAKTIFASEEAPAEEERRTIPMAAGDIKPGTFITEAHIADGLIPPSEIDGSMILRQQVVVGRYAKEAIPARSPFRLGDLQDPGYRPSIQVKEGMRAVSVGISDSSDVVEGLLDPGDFVDVHMTVSNHPDRRIRGGLTMTLFRGVKILAVSSRSGVADSPTAITLELTPEQANIMILARDRGDITLTLNPDGLGTGVVDVPESDRATLEQILGLRPTPEPEPPLEIEHFDGSRRDVLYFNDGRRVWRSQIDTPGNDLNYNPINGRPDREPAPKDEKKVAPTA